MQQWITVKVSKAWHATRVRKSMRLTLTSSASGRVKAATAAGDNCRSAAACLTAATVHPASFCTHIMDEERVIPPCSAALNACHGMLSMAKSMGSSVFC